MFRCFDASWMGARRVQMIVGTIICHVLSHYKNKHYIRLLHRLIKKQGTNGLHASMTPFIPCFSITPSKERTGYIALILAMLVAFASRTRLRGFSPSIQVRKKEDILNGYPLFASARRGSNPRPPPWQGGAPPLSHSRMLVIMMNLMPRKYLGISGTLRALSSLKHRR